jgi:hypothetical protein
MQQWPFRTEDRSGTSQANGQIHHRGAHGRGIRDSPARKLSLTPPLGVEGLAERARRLIARVAPNLAHSCVVATIGAFQHRAPIGRSRPPIRADPYFRLNCLRAERAGGAGQKSRLTALLHRFIPDDKGSAGRYKPEFSSRAGLDEGSQEVICGQSESAYAADPILPCGRCQLYRCSHRGSSAARSGCGCAAVLEPAEHVLNFVSLTIEFAVMFDRLFRV